MANQIVLLIEGLESAAIRKTEDGLYSVYDAIAVCGAKNPRDTFKRLSDVYSEYEVVAKPDAMKIDSVAKPDAMKIDSVAKPDAMKIKGHKFRRKDGKIQAQETPVASKQVVLEIIGLLPGKMGKAYRSAAAELVVRYIEADTSIAVSIAERTLEPEKLEPVAEIAIDRSTNAHWLNQTQGRLRDRLTLIEGKDFRRMRDGTTSITPTLLSQDDTDSSYAKVLHIAQHEMTDEELIRAGMFASDVATRQNLGHPEKIDAIADYLGLIKNGWIDPLYRMRRDRFARKPTDFLEEMEDVKWMRTRN